MLPLLGCWVYRDQFSQSHSQQTLKSSFLRAKCGRSLVSSTRTYILPQSVKCCMEYRTALDHFITRPNFTTVTSIRLILISISPTSLHNLAKLKVSHVGIDNLPSIFFAETPCRDSDECLVYLFEWLKDLNSFYPESLYKLYISV